MNAIEQWSTEEFKRSLRAGGLAPSRLRSADDAPERAHGRSVVTLMRFAAVVAVLLLMSFVAAAQERTVSEYGRTRELRGVQRVFVHAGTDMIARRPGVSAWVATA